VIVRDATLADAEAVQALYAHHVLTGSGTFEERPPTVEEMSSRMQALIGLGLPYVVAEIDGVIAAFAYAGPFRTRAAYRHTLEDTVYVAEGQAGRGLGRAVLQAVIDRSRALAVHQLIAVIGGSDNQGSIGLHAALGFRQVGVLEGVGYKFGRWLDVVHMQLALNGGADAQPTGPGLAF
jgi:L-amino acid N-acyltransferase YncA